MKTQTGKDEIARAIAHYENERKVARNNLLPAQEAVQRIETIIEEHTRRIAELNSELQS